MEYNLGFAHFLASTDGVARVVLGLMLVMSVGTWYLIVTKGVQAFLSEKRSRDFLAAFWRAPNLDAVAHRLRENGVNEPFSHLVHHGFTAIEQHRAGRARTSSGARWRVPIRRGAASRSRRAAAPRRRRPPA